MRSISSILTEKSSSPFTCSAFVAAQRSDPYYRMLPEHLDKPSICLTSNRRKHCFPSLPTQTRESNARLVELFYYCRRHPHANHGPPGLHHHFGDQLQFVPSSIRALFPTNARYGKMSTSRPSPCSSDSAGNLKTFLLASDIQRRYRARRVLSVTPVQQQKLEIVSARSFEFKVSKSTNTSHVPGHYWSAYIHR